MKSYFLFFGLLLILCTGHGQRYDQLTVMNSPGVTTYFSKGYDQRAKQIATRVENVISYYYDLINFKPSVSLLILSKADWRDYTKFPVYGMPHYTNNATLIIAAEDNEFWRSFLSLKDLPEETARQARQIYSLPDTRLNDTRPNDSSGRAVGQGSLSMQAFFDLLAIHELGHAFHNQGKLQMQRKWMGELFCNILLHTYIAEKEPEQLPALALLPKIVVSGGTKNYKYTSLKDLEDNYTEIGQQHPQNYGWYQFRWHVAAANTYDTDGKGAFQRLWTTLQAEQSKLNDTLLAELLQTKVGNSVADVMLRWEADMVR